MHGNNGSHNKNVFHYVVSHKFLGDIFHFGFGLSSESKQQNAFELYLVVTLKFLCSMESVNHVVRNAFMYCVRLTADFHTANYLRPSSHSVFARE